MFKRSRRRIVLTIMGSLLLLFTVTLSVILLESYREIRSDNRELLEEYADMYMLEQEDSNASDREDTPDGAGPQADSGRPGGMEQEPPEEDRKPPEASDAPEPRGDAEPQDGNAPEPRGDAEPPEETVPPKPDERRGGQPVNERRDYKLSTFYAVAFDEDGAALAVDTGERDTYTEEELTVLATDILALGSASGQRDQLSYLVVSKGGYTLVALMDNTVTENNMRTLLRYVVIVGCAAMLMLFVIALWLSGQIIRPLEESDREQRRFISDASHELKTPVAVIGANADVLSR